MTGKSPSFLFASKTLKVLLKSQMDTEQYCSGLPVAWLDGNL